MYYQAIWNILPVDEIYSKHHKNIIFPKYYSFEYARIS